MTRQDFFYQMHNYRVLVCLKTYFYNVESDSMAFLVLAGQILERKIVNFSEKSWQKNFKTKKSKKISKNFLRKSFELLIFLNVFHKTLLLKDIHTTFFIKFGQTLAVLAQFENGLRTFGTPLM